MILTNIPGASSYLLVTYSSRRLLLRLLHITQHLAASSSRLAASLPISRIYFGINMKDAESFSRCVGDVNAIGMYNGDSETREGDKELLLNMTMEPGNLTGGIVALGKFDALHVGHRALAIQASKMGSPFLLSFSGIGEVLGWEKRLPIVAPCDRQRVMSLWMELCGGATPQEYQLEFAKVRHLSPKEFIEKLALELKVKGVVAGANYRLGYKAAGDASDLMQLCTEYGLAAYIVDPVMDKFEKPDILSAESKGDSREKGQVSSTRVRNALLAGDMKRVMELLGRKHRLLLTLENFKVESNVLSTSLSSALNQPPGEGTFNCKIIVKTNENSGSPSEWVDDAEVKIEDSKIHVTLYKGRFTPLVDGKTYIALDFESSSAQS